MIDEIQVEATDSRREDRTGNKKLLSFGCEKQKYSIKKTEDNEIVMNVCGWTIKSFESFDLLYKFIVRTQNSM